MKEGLDNVQLEWLIGGDPLLRSQFVGVFAADQLPPLDLLERPCSPINTEKFAL